MITKLGKFIDPLSDKLMVFTALTCTAVSGHIHPFFPAAYFIKEGWQGIQAVRLAGKIYDVPPANRWGKNATLYFYIAIAISLLFPGKGDSAAFVMLCAALICSLVAYYTLYLPSARQKTFLYC